MAILANPAPVFQQAMRIISSISNANPAAVVTTFDHQYISGMVVRLNIPPGFGMQQANQLSGQIAVTGGTTFTIDIDTTHFDAYAAPSSFPYNYQYGQVVPTGENNSILLAATRNVLPY
jgi:hypothetical protein